MSLTITATKSCNYTYVDFGDIIKYEIIIQNIGDVPIFNCYLIDTLPSDITFTSNSIFINNTQMSSYNFSSPITLPDLSSQSITTLTYECSVNGQYPFSNSFNNISNIIFSSTVTGSTLPSSILSNTVTNNLNKALLNIDKFYTPSTGLFVNTPYEVVIQNFGNIIATNLVLFDTFPDSVAINNTSILEDNSPISGNLSTGLSLQNLSPNAIKTVTYNYFVTSLPSSGFIKSFNTINYDYLVNPLLTTILSTATARSYYATTAIQSAFLNSLLSVSPSPAMLGQTITYTLSLTNVGNSTAEYINMSDTLPSSLTFINNSININNSPTTYNLNSVSIPDIVSGGTSTITFNAIVNTIPSTNLILNSALIDYKSLLPSSSNYSPLSLISNVATLPLINTNTIVNFTKLVSNNYATNNSIVTYTFVIENLNSFSLTDCILMDTLPNSVSFITNSVLINLTPSNSNPLTGITIPQILSGETITVSFNVQIN
ncbi:MAG: hypothetical protein ACRC7N_08105 [Clostridium sp.]